jgi:hypothetical protein
MSLGPPTPGEQMFNLTLVDHIRLSFASIVSAYEGHADAAARLARWAWYAKVALLSLAGLTAVTALIAQMRGGAFHTVTSVVAVLAFVVCGGYIALDPEPRVYAHRSAAARLWLVCEKYRALLTEVHDKLLDVPTLTKRRDALLQEASAVFEQAPPADRHTYDIAREAFSGGQRGRYSDQDVDQFLPRALRRAKPAAP